MSDLIYQQRAARQRRNLILAGVLLALGACLYFGLTNLFHDSCTQSFTRDPRAVVVSFIQSVQQGDRDGTTRCWVHNQIYDWQNGCIEACLEHFQGKSFDLVDVTLGNEETTPQGRANLKATVTITCKDSGQTEQGEILLDSVASRLPWRHWKIGFSTFGGSFARPWCP